MPAEVVTLRDSHSRQASATLRVVADEIDAGLHGEVECVAVAMKSDLGVMVFGMGEDRSESFVATLFAAAHAKMLRLFAGD